MILLVTHQVKDLNAARGKVSFRSVSEVDERIKYVHTRYSDGLLILDSGTGNWISRLSLVA